MKVPSHSYLFQLFLYYAPHYEYAYMCGIIQAC
jgi:hypothetical protein